MTQSEALDILKLGHNVYLTGSAGSGKTYVLNKYIEYLRSAGVSVGVTASTGIAATHLNGVTIHSWSGLGVRDSLPDTILDAMEEKKYLWNRFQETRVLIIDEVSMLHHFRLDLVDKICRAFRRSDAPFGGLQVILCGDFFQLPPVRRAGEPEAHFIHRSDAWQNMDLKVCYLEEQFRQSDPQFLQVLQAIRDNDVTEGVLELLQQRLHKPPANTPLRPTKLYTHNIDVDSINERELQKLSGDIHEYDMVTQGRDVLVLALQKSCLAPTKLRLKKGAHVMFVKNNYEVGYVNGTLGTVKAFDDDGVPLVETLSGKSIVASPMEWSIEEDGKKRASVNQIPLRLAWAITVHKSQGMSLDAVEVDLSKSFEPGMGYVALSRVRTLDGLTLLGLNGMALRVHEEVLELDQTLRMSSAEVAREIGALSKKQKEEAHKLFLKLIAPKIKKSPIPTHLITKTLLAEKKTLKEVATSRELTVDTILDHIEKIQKEGVEVDIRHIKSGILTDARLKKILDAFATEFKKSGDYRLAPVKNALGTSFSYTDIRLARLFLTEK